MRITSAAIALVSNAADTSFLDTVQIEFGPVQLLGRFFVEADKRLRANGIALTCGTIEEAHALQQANDDSWPNFPPMLDPRLCGIDAADSYCFVGRDTRGAIVAVQAGRIYKGREALSAWISSGRFVYGRKQPQALFHFEVPSTLGQHITGPFAYSGGLWIHPNYRGAKLCSTLVRLSRAYALAHWNTDHTVTFVQDRLQNSPIPQLYGYTTNEPGVVVRNLPDGGEWRGHFLAIDRTELAADLSRYLLDRLPQIDPAIVNRSANQHA